MKNNLKKRILSLFLSVMMVIGMIPTASLTAFAAGSISISTPVNGAWGLSNITVDKEGSYSSAASKTYNVVLNESCDQIGLTMTLTARGPIMGSPKCVVNGVSYNYNMSNSKATATVTPEWDSNGSYTVTIVTGSLTETFTLNFTAPMTAASPVKSVSLDKETETIKVGATTPLSATVTYEDASADSKVNWSSSDETVATVDANGVVTGKKEGTATITATTKGKDANGQPLAANCAITVEKEPVTAIVSSTSPIVS